VVLKFRVNEHKTNKYSTDKGFVGLIKSKNYETADELNKSFVEGEIYWSSHLCCGTHCVEPDAIFLTHQ
jgi:hypothetical protein